MPDELVVLGSSSGEPTRRRFPSAYALKVASGLFLVDCGAPVSSLLYEHGLDPLEVRSVFVSHWHMDHVANLGLLLTHNHSLRRSSPLTIYGPKGTRGKVKRLLIDSFLTFENLNYKLQVHSVKPDQPIKEGLLQVHFFETKHLDNLKYKTLFGSRAVSCGMVLDGPGWRVVYSGDLASPQELAPYADRCDLLIHELTHVQPEEVADFAAAAKVPHLLISHISRKYDETPEKIRQRFAGRYQGDLMIAEDGMRLRLGQEGKSDSMQVKLSAEKSAPSPPGSKFVAPALSEQASPHTAFLEALEEDFYLSPFFSRQILKAAQKMLLKPTSAKVDSGQIRLEVERVGAGLAEQTTKVEVVVTVYQVEADREVQKRERSVGLRRGRILRLMEEALDQDGVLAEADLAHLLGVDKRLIRRDLEALEAEGHAIYTWERLQGGLPGWGCRDQAIARWINHENKDEIARWLHQSTGVVQSYIDKFAHIAQLYDQNKTVEEITASSKVPIRMVKNYLEVYRLSR
ncbi:MAG TPA: DUF1670 domain-containing protein [Anaerolineae bacterium]|nr:DUF1670 domain-containing protein [Anaerolineae bacterium]